MPDAVHAGPTEACDLFVIGGGVNGAGIARDAVGRGLKVTLCEKDDFAAHTSSASTKLIHGGLRYLEYYEFGLVRKALIEREVLLRNAPHIMGPLRFVMPHDPSMRPAWMIRLGLMLYDHLARREWLPGSRAIRLDHHEAGRPLAGQWRQGFVYSDGWVDDARLVVLNAQDAADRGALVLKGAECVSARREADRWQVAVRDRAGQITRWRARALVNAAGPWAAGVLERQIGRPSTGRHLRLIKGSHIVVPRLYEHDHAYIFQNVDKRIVFAIPFQHRFTLIGTTDVEIQGDPGRVGIDADETAYLCAVVNRYLRRPVTPGDVVWSYAGVRPLLDDESGNPAAVTRDYALEYDRDGPPLLSIWGGKITTYRRLAEEAVDGLMPAFGRRHGAWTASAPLPGGDLRAVLGAAASGRPDTDFAAFVRHSAQRYPWLDAALVRRYAHAYGAGLWDWLGAGDSPAALGRAVAPGLYEAEIEHLIAREWVTEADDLLWRRSKLGLSLTPGQRQDLAAWLRARLGHGSTAEEGGR